MKGTHSSGTVVGYRAEVLYQQENKGNNCERRKGLKNHGRRYVFARIVCVR